MKRLLIISRSSHPKGGADRIIADLCRMLPDRGWQVTLGLVKGERFNRPSHYREIHPDLPVIEIDGAPGTRRARVAALERATEDQRPDAVLVMRVFDAYEAVSRIKHRHPDHAPRLIVGVRAYEDGYLGDLRRYRDVVDGCITSGRLIARALVDRCGMACDRVFSIPGGVAAAPSPTRRYASGNPVRLLYAGRLEQPQKRVLDLVPLVEHLTLRGIPFHLDIAGDGPEQEMLQRKLAPWIERGDVSFAGWLDAEALHRTWYPRADIFLHFAAWEGVTIAPREAMAHGVVPVISNFTGLHSEGLFVDGHNARLFPVGAADAAAECVAELVARPDLFARLSAAAAVANVGIYSDTGAMDAWNDALRTVLAKQLLAGRIPPYQRQIQGRLGSMGLPGWLEDGLRTWLGKPVRHNDPGSEWPTHSGLTSEAERAEFAEFARSSDRAAGAESGPLAFP